MLDAFIIERKRREQEAAERPTLQLPLPVLEDVAAPKPDKDEPRGSIEVVCTDVGDAFRI